MFRNASSVIRAVIAVGLVSMGTASVARAQFVSNSPDPFLGSMVVLNSAVFSTPFGYTNQETISNFNFVSSSNSGANLLENYTANMNVTFYTTAALTTVSGTASLTGVFDVTEMGRPSIFSTGNFSETLTTATFNGTAGGQALQILLNPAQTTTGMAMITAGPNVGQYTINNPFTVYGGFDVNGGAFTATPVISANNVPVPEPATLALFGMSLVGMSFVRRKKSL